MPHIVESENFQKPRHFFERTHSVPMEHTRVHRAQPGFYVTLNIFASMVISSTGKHRSIHHRSIHAIIYIRCTRQSNLINSINEGIGLKSPILLVVSCRNLCTKETSYLGLIRGLYERPLRCRLHHPRHRDGNPQTNY